MSDQTTEDPVDAAIALLEQRARELGAARVREMSLEDDRALVKRDAIKRLVESGAATSATGAERIVEADLEYEAHRAKQFMAVIAVEVARGLAAAAKLRAEYALLQVAAPQIARRIEPFETARPNSVGQAEERRAAEVSTATPPVPIATARPMQSTRAITKALTAALGGDPTFRLVADAPALDHRYAREG